MALAKARTKINAKGYGYLLVREISPTPSNSWLDVGYIQVTDFEDTRESVEAVDERGWLVDNLEGGQRVKLTTQLMQSNIDVIAFLKAAGPKYYEIMYKGTTADTQYQKMNGIGKVTGGLTMKFAANSLRTISLVISMLPWRTAMARTPTDYNVALGDFYVWIEAGSDTAMPSDTAADVATAAL